MFFETDAAYAVGSAISLKVELATPGAKMMLKCHGSIVRIELRGKRVGVAVKISESTMEPVR